MTKDIENQSSSRMYIYHKLEKKELAMNQRLTTILKCPSLRAYYQICLQYMNIQIKMF